MAADSPIETEVDALYGLALGEFTAARNALAKALRKDKRADDGARVAKLPKPTAAAWALNQTVRRRPDLVQALSRAGENLRRIQAQVLAGQADGSALPLASEARRTAVRAVVRAMNETLDAREAQRTDEWVRTLEAASVDAAIGALLVRGRFTTVVHEGIGFDGLLSGADPTPLALRLVPPLGAESDREQGEGIAPVEDRAAPDEKSTTGKLALDRGEAPRPRTSQRPNEPNNSRRQDAPRSWRRHTAPRSDAPSWNAPARTGSIGPPNSTQRLAPTLNSLSPAESIPPRRAAAPSAMSKKPKRSLAVCASCWSTTWKQNESPAKPRTRLSEQWGTLCRRSRWRRVPTHPSRTTDLGWAPIPWCCSLSAPDYPRSDDGRMFRETN